MRYMLLIHQGTAPTPRTPDEWERLPEDERQAIYADYRAIGETRGVSPGVQLDEPETATTVRVEDGRTLTTDGPFVETKEWLVGFWILECASEQRAFEIAARASAAPGPGGAPLNMPIQVRQVMPGPPAR